MLLYPSKNQAVGPNLAILAIGLVCSWGPQPVRAAEPKDIGLCPAPPRQQLRAMARPEADSNVRRTPEEERDFRLTLSDKFSQKSLEKALWRCACAPVDISRIIHGEAWAM